MNILLAFGTGFIIGIASIIIFKAYVDNKK